jgi:hypothetical protein
MAPLEGMYVEVSVCLPHCNTSLSSATKTGVQATDSKATIGEVFDKYQALKTYHWCRPISNSLGVPLL